MDYAVQARGLLRDALRKHAQEEGKKESPKGEASGQGETQEAKAPAPAPWGVLYARPNPDGSRKKCGNCMMWVSGEEACAIHEKSQSVKESMVCGYHVFGKPMKAWMDHPGIEPVTPEFSGLEEVGEGTSCDTCKHYEIQSVSKKKGLCHAVAPEAGKEPPTPVDALGCCARWEKGARK